MTPFEIVTAILNLLALILIPIIAVIIGQHLAIVGWRKDRLEIFSNGRSSIHLTLLFQATMGLLYSF